MAQNLHGPKKTANICGRRIAITREQQGLTPEELAHLLRQDYQLSLTKREIVAMENQERHINDIELNAIASLLSINPEWLLRGEDKHSRRQKEEE